MEMLSSEQGQMREGNPVAALKIIIMNLWCWPLMLLWTLFGIITFPLAYAFGKGVLRWSQERTTRWIIWMYGRGWLVIMSPFVRFRREGMEHVRTRIPHVLVVNHLSFFDTYCMALLPICDITFAVRSWPFRMFWYSKFMRLARYLDVESNSWDATEQNCQSTFADNGAVLFFPEGHRSRDGELQRFYSGAFKVAAGSDVVVVPLCISGTNVLMPPDRKYFKPCQITLKALPPIEVADFKTEDGHMRLRKLVKAQMAEELQKMKSGGNNHG